MVKYMHLLYLLALFSSVGTFYCWPMCIFLSYYSVHVWRTYRTFVSSKQLSLSLSLYGCGL